jgi:hypothetical protein
LGELFNVFSFEALSALSADDVEAIAKKAGKIMAKGEVANWIAQSKMLAAKKSDDFLADDESDGVEMAVSQSPSIWKPIASFVVEFQQKVEDGQVQRRTTVHHMEADEEISWPGIEREQLGLWLEQHVQVNNPPPKIESAAAAPKIPRKTAEGIRPGQVRVRQQEDYLATLSLLQPERPFLGHVHHAEPITLEVDFELDDSETEQTGRQHTGYEAQCELRNLTANQKPRYLEMEREVLLNCLTYKTDLSKLQPGIYHLAVLMRGKRPSDNAYFELPKLNIM